MSVGGSMILPAFHTIRVGMSLQLAQQTAPVSPKIKPLLAVGCVFVVYKLDKSKWGTNEIPGPRIVDALRTESFTCIGLVHRPGTFQGWVSLWHKWIGRSHRNYQVSTEYSLELDLCGRDLIDGCSCTLVEYQSVQPRKLIIQRFGENSSALCHRGLT